MRFAHLDSLLRVLHHLVTKKLCRYEACDRVI